VRTPSQVVEGRQGPELMQRFWDELIAELDKVEPGVSAPYNASK
jgi:hypothetical protein